MKEDTEDTIEKQALILRLSVNIYQMTDDQIRQLLKILDPDGDMGIIGTDKNPLLMKKSDGESFKRQMMIARAFVLIKRLDRDVLLERLKVIKKSGFSWSRAFTRMDYNVLVDFVVEGKAYRGYLRDVSAGGIFVVTSEKLKIGKEVSLCFTLSESEQNLPFKVLGTIKRCFDDGIGIQYQNISLQQQSTIDGFIQKNKNHSN